MKLAEQVGRPDAHGAIRVRPRSSAVRRAAARILIPAALRAMAVSGACRPAAPLPPPGAPPGAATTSWPRTVAEAVELKLRTMPDGEKAALRQTPRDRVQDAYHGFQMLHRADFGLGEGNDQLLESCGSVRMPAEECMRIILDALWVALQGGVRGPASLL